MKTRGYVNLFIIVIILIAVIIFLVVEGDFSTPISTAYTIMGAYLLLVLLLGALGLVVKAASYQSEVGDEKNQKEDDSKSSE